MARLFLEPGQTFGTIAGFNNTEVIGTNSAETVFLTADAEATFDSSFNRGGDILNIGGVAGLYTGALQGSRLVLTASNGAAISIPVGTVGTTINFADGGRQLVLSGNKVLLGTQEITVTPVDITDGTGGTGSADFNLTATKAAGVDVMHITGDQSVRTDFTKNDNQVTGIDLNRDGLIALNGVESGKGVNVTTKDDGKDFEVVDAYVRNRSNYYDASSNFLGSLLHDGTGFNGDGTNTNGNIVLGGLGADRIFGGIGNDFIVGGGVLPTVPNPLTGDPLVDLLTKLAEKFDSSFSSGPQDLLSGGRNADFFFADFSTLSLAEGDALFIDAGTTADDSSAETSSDYYGGQVSSQDSDWFLGEFADDEEPIVIRLAEGDAGSIYSEDQVSDIYADIYDIENFDASGNLYGFLDDLAAADPNFQVGEGRVFVNGELSSIGSSGQLVVVGSEVSNILVGGYDNDRIYGDDGNDILFGGNLKYASKNPNAGDLKNDGKDQLYGGSGDDSIVFEVDGGIIDGGTGGEDLGDTLYLDDQSLGKAGTTPSALTKDGVLRFDLAAQVLANSAGYGGADVNGTQDQSRYINPSDRVTVTNMENVIASGLGAIDYIASGGNGAADLTFRNQQNQLGYAGSLDLRGTGLSTPNDDQTGEAYDNVLIASRGNFNDVLEGREGNDLLSGGNGADDFIFNFGSIVDINNTPQVVAQDGVDVIASQADRGGDNLWDRVDAALVATKSVFVADTWGPAGSTGTRYWDTNNDGKYDLAAVGVGENAEDALGALLFAGDFNKGDTTNKNSTLNLTLIDKASPDNDLSDFPVDGIIFGLKAPNAATTTQYEINLAPAATQGTYQQFVDGLNAALDLNPALVNLNAKLNGDLTITITDSAGGTFTPIGYSFVNDTVPPNGNLVFSQVAGAPEAITQGDRIVYTSYEDRADGEKRDDDAVLGSNISLGQDGYAEDLVAYFGPDGTRLAEDQQYQISFNNLTTQDKAKITINGVDYALQVGVNLDGNIIANEDGPFDNQQQIQENFLNRFVTYINSFLDDDTSAGQIGATAVDLNSDGFIDGIIITQVAYSDGEETVFVQAPVVDIKDNSSGGEGAFATVENLSAHEVHLFDFDGRNNALNSKNVVFVGDTGKSRSVFETTKDDTSTPQTLNGSDAVVIDNRVDDLENGAIVNSIAAAGKVRSPFDDGVQGDGLIADSKATNAPVTVNYSVHGDDFLIGGKANDTIRGGTGDDRVIGSVGTDALDGGRNYYTVQVAGEDKARVYELNNWEANNFASLNIADLAGKVYAAPVLLNQSETGVSVVSGVFQDTLQFQQADFTPGVTRFTITLDNFSVTGGVVQLKNDGAGTVQIDINGDGDFADTIAGIGNETLKTSFTNFEHIRTVSGVGKATADYTDEKGAVVKGGQGFDTLNVTALSNVVGGTGGILYNLTNNDQPQAGPPGFTTLEGGVYYSKDALTAAPHSVQNDYESLVMVVDGVENVIGGTGNDVLLIDETEAAKNNLFDGGLGTDRIEYQNNLGSNVPEPSVTILVNTGADQDQVKSVGGRNGTANATDTLNSVEFITLTQFTAQGTAEDDTIDVTRVTAGAIVDYTNGKITDNNGNLLLTIENIWEMEVVNADPNDTVIVGDADIMGKNATADNTDKAIPVGNFLDYDDLNATNTARVPFAGQVAVTQVNNLAEFKFNLGKDIDRVDYSKANDRIVGLVAVNADKNYVMINGDSANDTFNNSTLDRVDQLTGVEQIVASTGKSTLDLTGLGQDTRIDFQFDSTKQIAGKDRLESTIRIADSAGNTIAGIPNYIEYYDLNKDAAVPAFARATWNSIEGSDKNEVVTYDGSENLVALPGLDHRYTQDTLNLRGGNNEVSYNKLDTSIITTVKLTAYNPATPTTTGLIIANNTFTDGGAGLLGGSHDITSYSQLNKLAPGFLKLEASSDKEDSVTVNTALGSPGLYFSIPSTASVIDAYVNGNSTTGLLTLRLTGYENLIDGASNDVYDFGALANLLPGGVLKFIDNGPNTDQDTIKVGDDAASALFGGSASTIDINGINAALTSDFTNLDITRITSAAINTIVASALNNDLVIGRLPAAAYTLTAVDDLVITQATLTDTGSTFSFNGTNQVLTAGSKTLDFDGDIEAFSFRGNIEDDTDPNQRGLDNGYVANVTTGITFTSTGAFSLQVYGGDGNDTITLAGGTDFLMGGKGNDTLSGGFKAAVGEVQTVTIDGTNLVGGEVLTIEGITIGTGQTVVVVANADADQIGTAFVNYVTNTAGVLGTLSTSLGSTLSSVSYDAANNRILFNYAASAGNVGDAVITIVNPASTQATNDGGSPAFGHIDGAAATVESDQYVFEATGANNGLDTINQFSLTDVLKVSTVYAGDTKGFLGGAAISEDEGLLSAGVDLTGGDNVGVVFGQSTLTAANLSTAAAAGKIAIDNDGKAVIVMSADANGVADSTNDAVAVYFVRDTAAGAAVNWEITQVANINTLRIDAPEQEFGLAQWSGANFG